MKLLYDLFPVLLFFIAYKQFGIYVATGVLMAATAVQIAYGWVRRRTVERMHVITFVAVLAFGSLTIAFRNPVFIKWKPTIVYWLLGLGFVIADLWKGMPPVQSLLSGAFRLNAGQWRRLNLVWVGFFAAAGVANLVVAYRFSEDAWVNFKLFGLMGLTFAFLLAQAFVLRKYLVVESPDS